MADLVLGPMLRYADRTRATVWVQTSAACTVRVLDVSEDTFEVDGRHYAILALEGLAPGSAIPYEVELDGRVVWPVEGFPASRIRTVEPETGVTIAFGSCRVSAPNHPPFTLSPADDDRGHGADALRAYARTLMGQDQADWPDALLMLGDQVYADELPPHTLAYVQGKRDVATGAREQAADFDEYVRLYTESWSDPVIRWLFSTVPSAMIFDDHDVCDDWNTSRAWRSMMQATDWWQDKVEGALMAYWLYQHLGNLDPDELAKDPLLASLRAASGDAGPVLREYAAGADREADGAKGARWSFRRDFDGTRLVVVDSRCGRVLDDGKRAMLDEQGWAWLRSQVSGEGRVDPIEHLVIGTSLPYLMPPGIHYLEAWNEATSAGAWGSWFTGTAEKIRQGVDLEHWAAFGDAFHRMALLLDDVASGRLGPAPRSIVFLSGDVHFGYLANAELPSGEAGSQLVQVVCSPFRNPIGRGIQRANRFARTAAGGWVGKVLARLGGVDQPPVRWSVDEGPWFGNLVSELYARGPRLNLTVHRVPPSRPDEESLETAFSRSLL